MTHAAFKKIQLDHVIDIILEAGGDPDHVFRHIADFIPSVMCKSTKILIEMNLTI